MALNTKVLEYAFQTPAISIIPISEAEKSALFNASIPVWDFLINQLNIRYYPVLTIFASERAVQYLKGEVENIECKLNPEYMNCLYHIMDMLRDVDRELWDELFGEKKFPNNRPPCKLLHRMLRLLKISIDNWNKDQIIRLTHGIRDWCNACWPYGYEKNSPDLLIELLNRFFEGRLSQEALIEILRVIQFIQHLDYLEQISEDKTINDDKKLKEIVQRVINDIKSGRIEQISDILVKIDVYLNIFKIEHLIDCLIEKAFEISIIPGGGEIETIYREIHNKYGCYCSPEYWKGVKKSKIYERVKRALGIPDDLYLLDLGCVFIYPFPIKEQFKRKFPGSTEVILWALFSLVLVHEHGHAAFRHALHVSGLNKRISLSDLEVLNGIRAGTRYIEEGLAMEMEYYYNECTHATKDPKLHGQLKIVIDDYVKSEPDDNEWPYAGKAIIDMYIDQVLAKPIKVKPKTILQVLRDIIFKWKEDPGKLQGSMSTHRTKYRLSKGLP